MPPPARAASAAMRWSGGTLVSLLLLFAGCADRTRAFSSEDLTVTTGGGLTLGATLTTPDGTAGALPGVLLVSGSGPNDRDEHAGAAAPLRVIAEVLSDAGFAVLRFDKRTCSPANGHAGCTSNLAALDVASLTIQDFRDDALAALQVLKGHPRVHPTGLAVIGHSQGATPVAPMVCEADVAVSRCVLLMGHGVPIDQVMVRQLTDLARTAQATAYSLKFAALRRAVVASPERQWSDPNAHRAELAAAVASVNPMPDGNTALFWATWIKATEPLQLRSTLTGFTSVRRGGRLLSLNSPRDFNCDETAYSPLVALVRELGGTAVLMDGMVHLLTPTPVRRAAVTADPSPVCSTVLQGLAAWLHGNGKHSGRWPSAPTSPCGAQGLTCEQCADTGAVCDASQRASLGLLASSGGLSAECRALFGMLMGSDPSVTVTSPELCDCWLDAGLASCVDAVCDCTLVESSPLTVSAAAAVCAATPPPAPHPAAGLMTTAFCDAASAGGAIVAACQHGRCTQTVSDMASPAFAAAVAGMDLDTALANYPCSPCNFGVGSLDSLDPAAEESLGVALKETLAFDAAAVVFDCGPGSPVEYEMLFTLPDLALAGIHVGGVGALGLALSPLSDLSQQCAGAPASGTAGAACDAPPPPSPPGDQPPGGRGPCGPVPLAVAMRFVNACNDGDFAAARCLFSPTVAAALDARTLSGLWRSHTCAEPNGHRIERTNGIDAVILRCSEMAAGLVQWSIAVGPGLIVGLHFDAYCELQQKSQLRFEFSIEKAEMRWNFP